MVSMPKWLVVVAPVCCMVLGVAIGQGESDSNFSGAAPTQTVTHYATQRVTQPAIPPSCAMALTAMARMMEANAAIAGAGTEQLDISHAARRAIFLKDWEELDRVMFRQTDLNNRIAKPTVQALKAYADLADAMEACQNEIK